MRLHLLAVIGSFPLLAAGCNINPPPSVGMQDSLEINLLAAPDDLHTPYVAGANFGITVATYGYPDNAAAGFTLKSSTPSVIAVNGTQSSPPNFQVTAVGVGSTTLTVVDSSGKVLDSHDVVVAQPDSVQLASHGLLLAGLSDSQAQVTSANVVEGGTATFLVRYFRGSQELYGNGAVTPVGTGAASAMTTASSFGDDRDWIEIDAASTAGSGEVALSVGNHIPATIPVQVVAPSTIVRVGTLAQSDANAQDGNLLYVFARAFDASGADVYGASYGWLVDGAPVTSTVGTGAMMPADVVSYNYKGSASESITATLDGDSSSTTVHGNGATVQSSADVGDCSVARVPGHGGGAAGAGFGLALGLGTALARRRRRRS